MANKRQNNRRRTRQNKSISQNLLARVTSPKSTVLVALHYEAAIAFAANGTLGFHYDDSLVYSTSFWSNYVGDYGLYRVREARMSYLPYLGTSIAGGAGSGLVGCYNSSGAPTGSLVPSSPTTLVQVVMFVDDYKPIYIGKPWSLARKSTRTNQMLWYATAETTTNTAGGWYGLLRGCAASQVVGSFVFTFVVEFSRS